MKKTILSILLLLILSPFVFAQINVTNYSLQENYFLDSFISGKVNLSFKNTPLDLNFTDNEGNIVSLKKFLNLTNYNYECSTNDCNYDYESTNEEESRTFYLEENESILLGFSFNDDIEKIKSVSFNITSNADSSKENQIKLDLFNDGTEEMGNTKPLESSINLISSCYNPSGETLRETTLSSNPFCQKYTIPESPGLNIGAWLKKDKVGNNNIKVSLYGKEGTIVSFCEINNSNITLEGSYVTCSINNLIREKEEYYVCVSLPLVGESKFYTRGYPSIEESKSCGFQGTPIRDFTGSYDFRVESKDFNSPGTIVIDKKLPSNEDLAKLFENYIEEIYGTLNCQKSPCYVPLRINSYKNQEITISGINIFYDANGYPNSNKKTINDLTQISSKVNSNMQEIEIGGVFKLKEKSGNRTYKLSFDEEEIINEKISIKNTTFSLIPTSTIFGYPQEFIINTDAKDTFSYFWDFGDNTNKTTQSPKVTQVYDSIGNYKMKIILTNELGNKIERTYDINVTSPKIWIDSRIGLIENSLDKLEEDLLKLNSNERKLLEEKLNVSNLKEQLETVKIKYGALTKEEEYTQIINLLINFDFPITFRSYESNSLPFYSDENLLPVDFLKTKSSTNVEASNEEIKAEVAYWSANNLFLEISEDLTEFETFFGKSSLVNKFTITINPLASVGDYYLFFDKDLISPISNLEVESIGDYNYYKLKGRQSLSFILESNSKIESIPIIASPELSNLTFSNLGKVEEIEKVNKVPIIIIAIIMIISFGTLLYILLKKWYDTRYEKFLFSDRNNLYNVLVYVNSQKKNGVENEEIKKNLRKSGWSQEQIIYIMKKFENKNTGMPTLNLKQEAKEMSSIKRQEPINNSRPNQPQGRPNFNKNNKNNYTNFNK